MQFQVTAIEFDFDDAIDDFPEHQFSNITDETIGMIWEACDEDDLIEEITAATGWCVKSIDYRVVLWWYKLVCQSARRPPFPPDRQTPCL